MVDANTRKTLAAIPLHKVNAGPRDGDKWKDRLKEELMALIMYVKKNKEDDNDWFKLESNPEGTRWYGSCWTYIDGLKYEFDVEFDIPVTYPTTSPEIALPELDGKTAKMYRGGKILCFVGDGLSIENRPLKAQKKKRILTMQQQVLQSLSPVCRFDGPL